MSKEDLEYQAPEDSDEEEHPHARVRRAVTCNEDPEEAELPPVDIDEDTFGMSVCSLTRDSWHMSKNGVSCSRITRLCTSCFLVLVTIGLQIALLHFVKSYVSARSVHEIRNKYDLFEGVMYGCNSTVNTSCTVTVNGKFRGLPDLMPHVDVARKLLSTLSDDDQDAICHIPLSQVPFFFLILVIWTLSCLTELRRACNFAYVIIMLDGTNDMADAMEESDDGLVITRMTCCMKALLSFMVFVPRTFITIFLLWCGCRWLLATTNFGDLILNAVALEFILYIKESVYVAVAPARSHLDLSMTKIVNAPRRMTAAWYNMVSSVSMLFVAILFVYAYMFHFQQVLPEYQWDVHDVCQDFLTEMYKV